MSSMMLDIETLGLEPGCVVLSVGAVVFDPRTFAPIATFYEAISPISSMAHGLTIESETVAWWEKQPAAVREAAQGGVRPLATAADDFCAFFKAHDVKEIWAQGMDFDMPIWARAMKVAGARRPWRFYNQRDTRTAYAMADRLGLTVNYPARRGDHHNAVDDALHQLACLKAATEALSEATESGLPRA